MRSLIVVLCLAALCMAGVLAGPYATFSTTLVTLPESSGYHLDIFKADASTCGPHRSLCSFVFKIIFDNIFIAISGPETFLVQGRRGASLAELGLLHLCLTPLPPLPISGFLIYFVFRTRVDMYINGTAVTSDYCLNGAFWTLYISSGVVRNVLLLAFFSHLSLMSDSFIYCSCQCWLPSSCRSLS